jgi:hypothetical protein
LCFEALFGLGWCNNNLNLAQMDGAKQLGYLRDEAELRFVWSARSDRSLMEPATLKYQLRPSQRIVHALAVGDAAMVSARISLHWHVNGRGNSTVAGRVANVNLFEARRPSQRSAPAHRNLEC